MKKRKISKKHRVYCTYFPDGRYYIGYSGKTDKLYEKYYGSSTHIKEYDGDDLKKETIAEYDKKNYAKIQEFLLQWQQRDDPNCINDMINIRLRLTHLSDFEITPWTPKAESDLHKIL